LSGGRDIFGSGAPTGVFSPEKGDPSNVTEVADVFDGSEPWENSVGAQETGDDQQRLLPLPTQAPLMSLVRDWRRMGGGEGGRSKAWVCTWSTYAQLVPESRL